MSEGKLQWKTTDDVTGAEEASLPDGSKFALHNIMGTLSLMYVGKDGKGNVIYRTPVGVPMAFKKAKQEAEKFLGIKKDKKDDKKADKKEDEVEEELGPENEWGTNELTNKEKAVTPGQTNEGYSDTYSTADVKKAILKQFPGAKIEIGMYSGRPIFDITHDSIPLARHGDKAFQMSAQDKYQGGKKIGKEWSCSFFKRSSESDSHIFGDGNSPEAAMLDLKNKLDIVESTKYPTDERQASITQNKVAKAAIEDLQKSGYTIDTVKWAVDYGIKNPSFKLLTKDNETLAVKLNLIQSAPQVYQVVVTTEDGFGEQYVIANRLHPKDVATALLDFLKSFPSISDKKNESLEEAKKDKVDDNNGYGYDSYTAQKWCKSGKYTMQPMSFKAKGPKRWVLVPKDKNESLEDACWSGYKAIGTKEKDGKTVPNCVPESTDEDLKSLQDLLNNPDEEFAVKNYGSVERYKKMIQDKIDRLQKNEAISGSEQVTLKSTDKLEVKYGSVLVNGRPFDVTDPDESLDWPKAIDANGNLVTWFKGRASNANTWSPEEITGHYTDKHATVEEQPEISERYIQTVQLITKETDRSIIEAFLTKHSVAGRESNLLSINTEFKRFKKLHEAKI